MKFKVSLLSAFILSVVIVFFLFGMVSAATDTKQVIPVVTVDSSGSLSIVSGVGEGNAIEFGNMAPGQTLTKPLTLGIIANDNLQLTVGKNQDLKDAPTNETIPSANFTYTSSAGTPAPPGTPTYAVSDTQFGTEGVPSNVLTGGEASDCQVEVTYKLITPAAQPGGYYTATHTYTLTVE